MNGYLLLNTISNISSYITLIVSFIILHYVIKIYNSYFGLDKKSNNNEIYNENVFTETNTIMSDSDNITSKKDNKPSKYLSYKYLKKKIFSEKEKSNTGSNNSYTYTPPLKNNITYIPESSKSPICS